MALGAMRRSQRRCCLVIVEMETCRQWSTGAWPEFFHQGASRAPKQLSTVRVQYYKLAARWLGTNQVKLQMNCRSCTFPMDTQSSSSLKELDGCTRSRITSLGLMDQCFHCSAHSSNLTRHANKSVTSVPDETNSHQFSSLRVEAVIQIVT